MAWSQPVILRGWGQPENMLANLYLSCLRIFLPIALDYSKYKDKFHLKNQFNS
jgi:hypothetical protein